MHQINSNTIPTIFWNKFKKFNCKYPTNFTINPTLWKNISTGTEQKQQ